MKIGYIILCHKEPEVVAAMVKCVIDGTENLVVIHVDVKSNIEPFRKLIPETDKVKFVCDRVSIYWGGFSSIEATMRALEIAVEYSCDRYVLLQGCDYPLHSNAYIAEFFEKNKSVEFLKAYNITKSYRKYNYMKCYGYHIYDGIDRNKKCISTFIARALTALNKLGIKYRKGYYQDPKSRKKYQIYWGWGHFALTHECVLYLLNIYKSESDFNRYFCHIFPADETYLQTIVYNSPFRYRVRDKNAVDELKHQTVRSMLNLTYFEYPNQVRVFQDPAEIPEDIKKKFLYIRKVSLNYVKKTYDKK